MTCQWLLCQFFLLLCWLTVLVSPVSPACQNSTAGLGLPPSNGNAVGCSLYSFSTEVIATAVSVDPHGNTLIVSGMWEDQVWVHQMNGDVYQQLSTPTAHPFSFPGMATVDSTGRLFVVNAGLHDYYDPSDGSVHIFSPYPQYNFISSIANLDEPSSVGVYQSLLFIGLSSTVVYELVFTNNGSTLSSAAQVGSTPPSSYVKAIPMSSGELIQFDSAGQSLTYFLVDYNPNGTVTFREYATLNPSNSALGLIDFVDSLYVTEVGVIGLLGLDHQTPPSFFMVLDGDGSLISGPNNTGLGLNTGIMDLPNIPIHIGATPVGEMVFVPDQANFVVWALQGVGVPWPTAGALPVTSPATWTQNFTSVLPSSCPGALLPSNPPGCVRERLPSAVSAITSVTVDGVAQPRMLIVLSASGNTAAVQWLNGSLYLHLTAPSAYPFSQPEAATVDANGYVFITCYGSTSTGHVIVFKPYPSYAYFGVVPVGFVGLIDISTLMTAQGELLFVTVIGNSQQPTPTNNVQVYRIQCNGTGVNSAVMVGSTPTGNAANTYAVAIHPVTGQVAILHPNDRTLTLYSVTINAVTGAVTLTLNRTYTSTNSALALLQSPIALTILPGGQYVIMTEDYPGWWQNLVIMNADGNSVTGTNALNTTSLFQSFITSISSTPEGDSIFIADSLHNVIVVMQGIQAVAPVRPSSALSCAAGVPHSSSSSTGSVLSTKSSSSLPTTIRGSEPLSYASLCFMFYSLSGDLDHPWSSALSVSISYNSTVFNTSNGPAVHLLSGYGNRVYTNRFGVSFSTPMTLSTVGSNSTFNNVLYLTKGMPVDSWGVGFDLVTAVQMPGTALSQLYLTMAVVNLSGTVTESASSRVDGLGSAFLSTVAGFVNSTVAASNVNSLAPSYTTCQAPITFTNGLRYPTLPSVANGAVLFFFSYFVSDGHMYSVHCNLTVTTTSAFATSHDQLGNPFQQLSGVSGTRLYTFLPTGATLRSNVTGLTSAFARFYPYTLLASSPGVYSVDTVPFLDLDGIAFNFSPAAPVNGAAPSTGPLYNTTQVYWSSSQLQPGILAERYFITPPSLVYQQQTYIMM